MNKIRNDKIRFQLMLDQNIYDEIKKCKPPDKNNQEFILDLIRLGLIEDIKN